jgi:hypothetical protein
MSSATALLSFVRRRKQNWLAMLVDALGDHLPHTLCALSAKCAREAE